MSFVLSCLVQFWAYAQPENYLVDYSFPLILIGPALLFELMHRWVKQPSEAGKNTLSVRAFTYMSKISFGIYFVHIVIMTIILRVYSFQGWFLSCKLLFLEVVSIGGSVLLIWLLSRVGFCKRRLFLIKD